jgi:hypothetical protein
VLKHFFANYEQKYQILPKEKLIYLTQAIRNAENRKVVSGGATEKVNLYFFIAPKLNVSNFVHSYHQTQCRLKVLKSIQISNS